MSAALVKKIDTRLMIGGDRVAAGDGSEFEVIDPATGEVIAMVSSGTPEDAVAAVAYAVFNRFQNRVLDLPATCRFFLLL
jgi:acyl-CoA reductase-like NAD-dependent aldehyde dehydrogenase